MKKIVITALLLGCASLAVHAADPAIVNGKPIKQSLLDFIIKDALSSGKQLDDAARANIIEKLITSEVIDQEAQKAGVDKQPDFVAREDLTRRELRVNAYLEDFIRKNPISEQAVQAEYDTLKSQLGDKEYKASHILVKTEQEAKDISDQLAKGADFGKIAKEKSIDLGSNEKGGDLGWFLPGSVVKPFGDAVVGLKKGAEVTVHTEFGWHVIRLEDSRETQPPPFDNVKNEIRNNLQRQQVDKLVSGLRAKAKVVNNTVEAPGK